ncbi:MAG TPA: SGNH/GDSL hydrolase family protein [Candidatus Atribacteria bacterium]|nr:SGNH/GDSL hydrolase family protein [Candidatus Atribacteria bacterium]
MIADRKTYLDDVVKELLKEWPENRIINIVCHGHSVPAGYFATPFVDTFNAYPHLLHRGLKGKFPFAVINVIVTAVGGEDSERGAMRFEKTALAHCPDVVTIDYGLNDRRIGLGRAKSSWQFMIEKSIERGAKVLLLTPTLDLSGLYEESKYQWQLIHEHAHQIRELASEYQVGLVDCLAVFEDYINNGGDIADLLSWPNHPNRMGHELIGREILRWFIGGKYT